MGYVPNRLAAAFGAEQASTLVGMCVPRLTSGLFGHVLDGVDRALTRLGYPTDDRGEQPRARRRGGLGPPVGQLASCGCDSVRAHPHASHGGLAAQDRIASGGNLGSDDQPPSTWPSGFRTIDCGAEMGRQFLIRRVAAGGRATWARWRGPT
jgi:LacI family transcriptional regulator, gluconate utilization system Gnt-I transcriptional repressor